MVSLRQLRYALAVEKTRHFRKAAEMSAVSQSALSTAIHELERQLGTPLFERNNKSVLITPMGKTILQRARDIVSQSDDLLAFARAQTEVLSGSLSIGMIPTICPYLLPVVLPELHAQYPALELNVSEETSAELVERVRRGDIDTAVLALPYALDGLLSFPFWSENFYWITQQDNAHAHQREVSTRELESANLMLLKDGHCLKDHALSACKLPESRAHSLVATSLNTLIQLVIHGNGTTLVPEIALRPLTQNQPTLSAVPLAEKGPHRRFAFIVRPNYPGVRNIEALISVFTHALNSTLKHPQ